METYKPTNKLKEIIGRYNKRTVNISSFKDNAPKEFATQSFWDNATIKRYVVFDLKTGNITTPERGSYPKFAHNTIIKPGMVLIQYGISNGHTMTAKIHFFEVDRNKIEGVLFEVKRGNYTGSTIKKLNEFEIEESKRLKMIGKSRKFFNDIIDRGNTKFTPLERESILLIGELTSALQTQRENELDKPIDSVKRYSQIIEVANKMQLALPIS